MKSSTSGQRTHPFFGLALILLLCVAGRVESAPVQIIVPDISASNEIDHEDYYFSRLLELALKQTEESHGSYSLKTQAGRTSDFRLMAGLLNGKVDVIWATTSSERETHMLPVRISLLKDLNSYRLFLIRADDQPRFSKVQNIEDLRRLKGGISPQWTDADIMQHNNLSLVFGSEYEWLFHMLSGDRFDYFSRGLYQIHSEAIKYGHLNIAIEKELMLRYENPFYFFVRKDSPELAERLAIGLSRAIEDGSFDTLFNSIPRYRWGMEQLQLNKRRIIPLANP